MKEKRSLTASDIPRGFRFSSAACGLKKKGGPDLALITSDTPASAAAVFTTNLVQAAPVLLSRAHLKKSSRRMRAIIVNSGNANCCTGTKGMQDALRTCSAVAHELNCSAQDILVSSTGVIGVPLKVERILNAIPSLVGARQTRAGAFARVTRAIMTTDTRPKWAAARCKMSGKAVRLLGCAKGAGMIHPNMATMLAFIVTDAALSPALLRRALREVADRTFNCISIDGDTSTNDTLAIFANSASRVPLLGGRSFSSDKRKMKKMGALAPEDRDFSQFFAALEKVCRALALAIVADGEGAHRLVEITVRGAAHDRDAKRIAQTIATSPLVKTALSGADPNWGRILAAAGRSGARFDPDRTDIWLAGIPVFRRGRPLPFDERKAHRTLLQSQVRILFDCGGNKGRRKSNSVSRHSANYWTCDFSEAYVRVNASYRT